MRRHKKTLVKSLVIAITTMSGCSVAWGLDNDRDQIMHVVSDTATYDRNQHKITYEGNVQVDQGSSHLDGDTVVVYTAPDNQNKIQQVMAYGNPAHYSTLPSPDKGRLSVEAVKITYDPIKKTVLLEGQGKISQDGNIFSGPRIWYDMANGVVHSLTNPGNQRTEVIIQPQQPARKK